MKKFSLIFLLFTAVAMTSCGNEDEPIKHDQPTEIQEDSQTEPYIWEEGEDDLSNKN